MMNPSIRLLRGQGQRDLDGYTMARKGTAAGRLAERDFPRPAFALPRAATARYLALVAINRQTFADAEALGWRQNE